MLELFQVLLRASLLGIRCTQVDRSQAHDDASLSRFVVCDATKRGPDFVRLGHDDDDALSCATDRLTDAWSGSAGGFTFRLYILSHERDYHCHIWLMVLMQLPVGPL
jgi:hypothetical protein